MLEVKLLFSLFPAGVGPEVLDWYVKVFEDLIPVALLLRSIPEVEVCGAMYVLDIVEELMLVVLNGEGELILLIGFLYGLLS
jgi:hypothetical protein